MTPNNTAFGDRSQRLLEAAEARQPQAMGACLDLFREYLLAVARDELPAALQPKVNPSDVVQDTFLEACRLYDQFQGNQPEEYRAWLRGILLNKLRDLHKRYFVAQCRTVRREQPPGGAVDPWAGPALAAATPTPSSALSRSEEVERLHRAMARLPDEYRLVLEWRNWQSLPFAEVGRRLNRSEDAARMLFTRAVDRLQRELETDHATG